jgi:hypothetical protein
MMRCNILTLAAGLVGLVAADTDVSTSSSTATPTVVLPAGTVVGSADGSVEYFRATPYAQPPTGSLRLKLPVRLETFGSIKATGVGPACPQMTAIDTTPLLLEVLALPDVQHSVLWDVIGRRDRGLPDHLGHETARHRS